MEVLQIKQITKMRNILFILLLPISVFSQSFIPNSEATMDYMKHNNYIYAFWRTQGWNAADSNSVIVFAHGGAGQTTPASMWNIEPMSYLKNGTWDGKLVKNNGDTVRFLFVGVRDTTLLNTTYTEMRGMYGYVITTLGVDTANSPDWKVIAIGLSAGANMLNRLVVGNGGSNHAWALYVKRFIFAATPIPYGTNANYSNYNRVGTSAIVRIHTTTTDGVTAPGFSSRLKDSIDLHSNATTSFTVWPDNCHCAWQYAYSVAGLKDPPGTHAPDSNEWRILVNDVPYVPEPDPGGDPIRVRMRIRVVE